MASLQQSLPHDYAAQFSKDAGPPLENLSGNGGSHPQEIAIKRTVNMADISEHTPLLHQDIPIESVCTANAIEKTPTSKVFCEELWTLIRYSLPVFGCVTNMSPIICSIHSLFFVIARSSSSTPSRLHPSYP